MSSTDLPAGNRALAFEDEYYHTDANFHNRRAQKLAAGRKRLGSKHGRKLISLGRIEYRALGQRLIDCAVNHRCGSGACPQCGVAVQRWLCGELMDWLEDEPNAAMVTIIPADPNLAPAALKDDSIARQKTWLRKTLYQAGLGRMPFVAALDVSLNSFGKSGPPAFWQPHWCGFTAGRSTTTLTAMLSAAAGKADHVATPVVTMPIRSRLEYVLSYGFKTRFEERIRPGDVDENSNVPIDHQHRRFGALMAYLHRTGLIDRIYTQNVELETD